MKPMDEGSRGEIDTLLISFDNSLIPVGVKYLHYVLLKNGHNSFILNLPHFNRNDDNSLDNIITFISEMNPKLIGMSVMTHNYFDACCLSRYLKKYFKSTPIIWGGIHPTISPESCLEYADYVCVGEGEKTILDVTKAISKGKNIKAVNNICYIEDNQIKKNPLYPPIENLDDIAPYEHVPVNTFIQKNRKITPLDKKIFKRNTRYRGTFYHTITSRGCPFSCTYCCNNFLSRLYSSKKIRRRSVSNIITELEKAIKDNPDIEYISFLDDCFLACSMEYLRGFCEAYKERIGKPFFIGATPIYVTRDKIRLLKDAGLSWIGIGFESGSDQICKEIYKRKSLKKHFIKATRIINEFSIFPQYDIILDNPFEKEEDKLETIRTLIETPRPFYPGLFSLILYPGTELYKKVKRECPEKREDSRLKSYLIYKKNSLNEMIRLSSFLSDKFMNKIVHLYKQNPSGFRFKIALFFVKITSAIIFEPLTYFRLIKLSQGGSYLKTVKSLPHFFKEGFLIYLNQFKRTSLYRFR